MASIASTTDTALNYPPFPSNDNSEHPAYQLQHHGASQPQSQALRNPNLDPSLDAPPSSHYPSNANLSNGLHPKDLAAGTFSMLPPPPSTHPTFSALHSFAQNYAAAHGYALSINTTAKNRARIKLACVCYGRAKNTHKLTPETRVRKNRQSAKTGCKMWIEGKRQDDGSWVLRVGEGTHNHDGRPAEGWAVQRKRTWGAGAHGARIGVGGVTAKEEELEMARQGLDQPQTTTQQLLVEPQSKSVQAEGATPVSVPGKHSHERGGLVWQIVEQEMAHKGGTGEGRDRGVGRTVNVLQQRLPGIQIFKRDVYNIRAHIKRARKAAGVTTGTPSRQNDLDEDGEVNLDPNLSAYGAVADLSRSEQGLGDDRIQIDPLLVAQCNDALRQVDASEFEKLRHENEQLKRMTEEGKAEMHRLKEQLEGVRQASDWQ